MGLLDNDKILLFFGNCSDNPPAEISLKIECLCHVFFPPIAYHHLRLKYKNSYLNSMQQSTEAWGKFSMKNDVCAVADIWNTMTEDTVLYARHNLWLASVFIDDYETK